MRSSDEVALHLARRVWNVFQRPLMYGGSAAGVDLILREYVALWAYVMDRDDEFENGYGSELEREDCGSANLSTRYSMNHPSASEQEIVTYVVQHWEVIATGLGISPT